MNDPGTYIEHDGRPAVRFVRTYPYPIERVWAAVSTSEELERWFPSSMAYEPEVGGTVNFSGDPHLHDNTGTVLAFDPPRKLAFTWGVNELHFELQPVGDQQCTFTLIDVLGAQNEAARNASGWTVCLGELDQQLAGLPHDGPHSETAPPFRPIYDGYVASGMPSGAEIPGDLNPAT
ncbi:MAG: hypothetical protein JWL73_2397 [Actinomycetia bacterium]|nr:hypothetical protein [Actinomycetes bacterium]